MTAAQSNCNRKVNAYSSKWQEYLQQNLRKRLRIIFLIEVSCILPIIICIFANEKTTVGKLTQQKMERPKKVSLKDIADSLGVSIASVSRALHGSPEVGEELRERVKYLAEKWNYRPNPFAQSLRKGSPKIIGVITPSINSHFHSSVIAGIEDEARKVGYSVICANSHDNSSDESACIDNLISMHVNGIIACLSQETTDYSKFAELADNNVPTVLYARTCLNDRLSSVISNDIIAAEQSTQHLINQGCRKIGFIGGPNHLDMVRRRKHGFIEALHEAKISVSPDYFRCEKLDRQNAYQSTIQLIEKQQVDGIMAINYDCVYGALEAIREKGLRIPEDIALIGFVDTPDVRYLTPSISSIADESFLMGQRSCQILLQHIDGTKSIFHEVLPMRITIRRSSVRNPEADNG